MIIRFARRGDVAQIGALLADDPLGQVREGAEMTVSLIAFDQIDASPMSQLIVVEAKGAVVGCCQFTGVVELVARWGYGGAPWALVKAVRVAKALRAGGSGRI